MPSNIAWTDELKLRIIGSFNIPEFVGLTSPSKLWKAFSSDENLFTKVLRNTEYSSPYALPSNRLKCSTCRCVLRSEKFADAENEFILRDFSKWRGDPQALDRIYLNRGLAQGVYELRNKVR